MKTEKTEIGAMACVCCAKTIPVRQAANGTLSMPCTWCGFPAYAKAGDKAHGLMLARVTLDAPPTPAKPAAPVVKKPAPAPTPAPAPVVKPRNTIFG